MMDESLLGGYLFWVRFLIRVILADEDEAAEDHGVCSLFLALLRNLSPLCAPFPSTTGLGVEKSSWPIDGLWQDLLLHT